MRLIDEGKPAVPQRFAQTCFDPVTRRRRPGSGRGVEYGAAASVRLTGIERGVGVLHQVARRCGVVGEQADPDGGSRMDRLVAGQDDRLTGPLRQRFGDGDRLLRAAHRIEQHGELVAAPA